MTVQRVLKKEKWKKEWPSVCVTGFSGHDTDLRIWCMNFLYVSEHTVSKSEWLLEPRTIRDLNLIQRLRNYSTSKNAQVM